MEGKEPLLYKMNVKFNEVEGEKVCLSAQEHTLRYKLSVQFSQLLSRVQLFATP